MLCLRKAEFIKIYNKGILSVKMKKILSIFLVLATLLLLVSCGDESEVPDGMKLVENDKKTYKLYVPQEWVVDITDGVSTAYANDKSNISLMTMQWSSSKYSSVEEYCDQYYKNLKATMQNVSDIEKYIDNQKFGKDSLPALKFIYTIGPDTVDGASVDGAPAKYKFMQIFSFDSSGQVYIFTYTALEENYEDHVKSVQQIIDTFTI